MKHVIIGTAGHVDHGKSTLIQALTGTNPDRLKEEQERGMTIDIGFAMLRLPDGSVAGIVDVPGHERFLKNMLAGVSGVDVVLMVIAADESVMPQTVEHLDILKILDVRNGVVALTKCDIVDPEWIAAVEEDVRTQLAGSFLHDAPIIRVSAVTGRGLEALKRALLSASSRADARNAALPFRLPVDRVFTRPGFGTVVTGTLVAGTLRPGDPVEVAPRQVQSRVRGLQVHGKKVEIAEAGTRVAVNLAGVETTAIERGAQLAPPGTLAPTRVFDATLMLLSDAEKPVKDRARVRMHIGTAEIIGRIRLLDSRAEITPADRAYVQFRAETDLACARGDRFVMRTYSPMHTVGGGVVLDAAPARHRKADPAVLERLAARERGTPEDVVESLLLVASSGVLARDLGKAAGLTPETAAFAVAHLRDSGAAVAAQGERLFHRSVFAELTDRATQTLEAYHRSFPLRAGMPKEELRSALGRAIDPRAYSALLGLWQADGVVTTDGATARASRFQVSLNERQENLLGRIEQVYRAYEIAVPTIDEVCREVKAPPDAVNALLRVGTDRGRFVRVGDGLFYQADTVSRMKAQITVYLETHPSITVGAFRDLSDSNRRFSLLALEYLDTVHFTKRVGDERVLWNADPG